MTKKIKKWFVRFPVAFYATNILSSIGSDEMFAFNCIRRIKTP